MSYKTILLYNNAYNGLPKDCEEYKILRIEYLKNIVTLLKLRTFGTKHIIFRNC